MKFNISAFTHVGTVRKLNQDNILVNGTILNAGEIHLIEQNHCSCFVADGVGGNNAGEFASNYILQEISKNIDASYTFTKEYLNNINNELISLSINNIHIKGTATTLTGLTIRDESFEIIHAGDSELWLLRNGILFKTTENQVFDETDNNSPIISYFGGYENQLKLYENTSLKSTLENDIFLLCSDGLFKSLSLKMIKSILLAEKTLKMKTKKIMENCLNMGADDNVSLILIEIIL